MKNQVTVLGLTALWVSLPLLTLLMVALTACEDMGGPPPRIIPGVSVDGVKFGDSKERVEALLGKPDRIGWSDGLVARRLYLYLKEKRYSLRILFVELEDGGFGPVDAFHMHEAYSGKTGEGLGIGSTRVEVLHAWGPPKRSFSEPVRPDDISDYYCFKHKMFFVYYTKELVVSMGMGPDSLCLPS